MAIAARHRATAFDKVRAIATKFPNVTEGTSWGAPSFKIKGVMFAFATTNKAAEPNTLAVRLSFVDRDWLIASQPKVFYLKPHYVDYPCVLVRLSKIKRTQLRELLENGIEVVSATGKLKRASRRRTAPQEMT